MVQGFAPGEECAACKGRCCRERGCCLSPEDLFQTIAEDMFSREELLQLLQKEDNLYAIDVANGCREEFYFLRMRHKFQTFVGVDVIGECVALSDSGCVLPMDKRPKGGRFLKSSPDFHCVQEYTKEEMEADWQAYQAILKDIYVEYEKRFSEDGTFERCEKQLYVYLKNRKHL